MSEPARSDVTVADDVVRCRNLAADNLAKALQALATARSDLEAWELECWKRLPGGYGIATDNPHWRLMKVSRP